MGWVTPDAPTPAELDACITCGLCLPVCPTFRLTGDETASPRGRLAAMSAVAEGLAEVDDTFADVMGFCLQCRACEVVCPSLVPFGRAMEGARIEVAAQLTGRDVVVRRRTRHTVVGRLLPSPRVMGGVTFAAAMAQRIGLDRILPGTLGRLSGLRRLPLRRRTVVGGEVAATGVSMGRVAVLAGCVMDPWFTPVHEALIDLLQRGGYDVAVPAGQTCCGALAAHDGDAADAHRLADQNAAVFAGYDLIVADAAGCSAHLAGYTHWGSANASTAARARDATVLVAELIDAGRLPVLTVDRGEVAVQDPCHLRHAQRIVDQPRRILRAAGYRVVEIDPTGGCCGAAGMYVATHPATSDQLGRTKADQVRRTGSTLVASANPGCEMQLRTHLGPSFRIAHPVEIYHRALLDHEIDVGGADGIEGAPR